MRNFELKSYGMIQISAEDELSLYGGRLPAEQAVYNVSYCIGFIFTIGLKAGEEIVKNLIYNKIFK
jgi:hypothetical protein